MVTGLQHNSLLSINKFTGKLCHCVHNRQINNIQLPTGYHFEHTPAHYQGCRDPATGLWRIPIEPAQTSTPKYATAQTENNSTYMQQMTINIVYELPSTKQIIRSYHATGGFPTKAAWVKAIKQAFMPHGQC